MAKEKIYSIGIFEEQGGYLQVKAKSKKQAEEFAQEFVDDNGFDFSPTKRFIGLESTYRETHLV